MEDKPNDVVIQPEGQKPEVVVKRKKLTVHKTMPKPKKSDSDDIAILSKNELHDALLMALDPKNISESIIGFNVVDELKKEKGVIYKKVSDPPKLKNEFLKQYVDSEDFGRQHFIKKQDEQEESLLGGIVLSKSKTISARSAEMNVNPF